MAKPLKERIPQSMETIEKRTDWQALADHARENPVLYAAAVVFLVFCALVGVLYRVHTNSVEREVTGLYARALDETDPARRIEALDAVAKRKSRLAPEALYLQGETAFKNRDYLTAGLAFERLRKDFPDYTHTPDAVEGLGFIEEEKGNYEAAAAYYREVLDKWPGSFAGRRQQLNLGRCYEQLNQPQKAVESYREQMTMFPGSNVARRAQTALDRLRTKHPELFPQAPVVGVTTPEGVLEVPSVAPEIEIRPIIDSVTPAEPGALPAEDTPESGETKTPAPPESPSPESAPEPE